MAIKESELVNKWLWKFHRTALQWRRVRLGVVPSHEMARLYSVILRWADAIFVEDAIVYIVEAKLRAKPDAIGQLLLYQKLFRVTPEFQQYWKYPIKLVFLTMLTDLAVVELCTEHEIQYEVYVPEDSWEAYTHDKLTI